MRGKENLSGRDELSGSGRYLAECGMDGQYLEEGKASRALYCLTVQLWYFPPMLAVFCKTQIHSFTLQVRNSSHSRINTLYRPYRGKAILGIIDFKTLYQALRNLPRACIYPQTQSTFDRQFINS